MNALLIALTMSLTDPEATMGGPGHLAAELPLRMGLFEFETEVEAPEILAPSFTSLVVAFDLPSYAELQGVQPLASTAVLDATETRPWMVAQPASSKVSPESWLKDWTQR
jgi:hypothetical protein